MTISSLHHTQGIRGYKYQKTERTADCEIYYLHSTAKQLACPRCQSRDTSIIQTGRTRDIRGLCIGLKKHCCASRPGAFAAGAASHEPIEFCPDPYVRYTKWVARFVKPTARPTHRFK